MPNFEDTDTQYSSNAVDDGNQDDTNLDVANDNDNDGQGDEGNDFFLTVDDRTRYRTPEDAIKGFQSAGRRIAELSVWDKEVSKAFGGLTPQQTSAILKEFIEMKRNGTKKDAVPAADASKSKPQGDETLTPEQKEVVDFLKKHGFITKAEADELRSKLDELSQGQQKFSQQTEEEKTNALATAAQTALRGEMKAAKLNVDEDTVNFMESSVKTWIEADPERVDKYFQGGEAQAALIKEGFVTVAKKLGITLPTVKNVVTYAQNKKQVLNRPQARTSQQSSSQQQRQRVNPENEGLTADVHNRARALFESLTGGE